MATFKIGIGAGANFATIHAYKLGGITDGDTLDIISDIDDTSSTLDWGYANNITITSALETKPTITITHLKSLYWGGATTTNSVSNIKIENVKIQATGSSVFFGAKAKTIDGFEVSNCIIANDTHTYSLELVTEEAVTATLSNFIFRNNLVLSTVTSDATVMKLGDIYGDEDVSSQEVHVTFGENVKIYENTIVQDSVSPTTLLQLWEETGRENVEIYDNILYHTQSFTSTVNFIRYIAGGEVGVFSNNLLWGETTGTLEWGLPGATDSHLGVDPLFTNVGADDYTLQLTSPALGTGVTKNIGWDQETVATGRAKSRVLSDPALTCPGYVPKDLKRGNPDGNVVDNSEGVNPSRNQAKVFHTGSNLSGTARAPHLSGLQKY
jgi:hypothetical protein